FTRVSCCDNPGDRPSTIKLLDRPLGVVERRRQGESVLWPCACQFRPKNHLGDHRPEPCERFPECQQHPPDRRVTRSPRAQSDPEYRRLEKQRQERRPQRLPGLPSDSCPPAREEQGWTPSLTPPLSLLFQESLHARSNYIVGPASERTRRSYCAMALFPKKP